MPNGELRVGSAEPRRSLARPHGSPRSGSAVPRPCRIARTAPAGTTRVVAAGGDPQRAAHALPGELGPWSLTNPNAHGA